MPDQEEREEQAYIRGSRAAYGLMLQECLRQLDYGDVEGRQAAWLVEREQIIAQLRDLCRDFGDNDWSEDLHLADVIEKHLGQYLYEREG